MSKPNTSLKVLIGAAALVAAASTIPMSAFAGECPAGEVGVDVTPPGPSQASGVTDDVLASIDIANEPAAIAGRLFRLRRLAIQPGGVVSWHDHGDRPALIYIVSGSITEYRSTCAVPIEHKAGEVSVENHEIKHWWKNNTDQPTVLIASDLLPDAMKGDNTM